MADGQAADGTAQARVRIAQAARELDRLEHEIAGWVGSLTGLEQYATPLKTLERTLLGAVHNLHAEVQAVGPDDPVGAVYASCRRIDRQAAIVRQVWAWFRVKFDQRDDRALSGLLAAADEVVWSCYQEAYRSAELAGAPVADRAPTPLPYIDPGGATEAFLRDLPPEGLFAPASGDYQPIRDFLTRLPVPVISLPAACLDSPWWLAYAAHEVGHHLQWDLFPGNALVGEVAEVIERAVLGEPDALDPAAAARWRKYGEEVFADACAVVSLGTGAVTAILQLELDTEAKLLAGRRGRYPPAVVRLALLAALADQLGLDGTAALGGFDPDALVAPRAPGDGPDPLARQREAARADLAQAGKVAKAVLSAPLQGAGPLPELFAFAVEDYVPGGRVPKWAESIQDGTAMPDQTLLRAPRDQIAGALLAWREIAGMADDAVRGRALGELAGRLPTLVAASRKAGVRAPEHERGPQDLSGVLIAALRATVDEGDPGDQLERESGERPGGLVGG